MKQKNRSLLEKRIEKNFQELKQRSKIREQYGVFTRGMLEDLFDKKFEEKFETIRQRLVTVDEKLDWLIGKYKSHDEEHILVNGKLSDHSDRLEIVEEKLGIAN
ncbi:MAG: hypothetical protein AAB961_00735 [Patescibacteria group bacterium]